MEEKNFNIDSFLDDFTREVKIKTNLKPENKIESEENYFDKIKENFETKTFKIKESKDLKQIKKTYDEIRKFDENIFKDIVSIEKQSFKALKEASKAYEENFLNSLLKKENDYLKDFSDDKNLIESLIQKNRFTRAYYLIKKMKNKNLLLEDKYKKTKSQITLNILNLEIFYFDKVQEFEKKELPKIKEEIIKLGKKIAKEYKTKNLDDLEKLCDRLEERIDLIDFIFLSKISEIKSISDLILKSRKKIKEFEDEKIQIQIKQYEKLFDNLNEFLILEDIENSMITFERLNERYKKFSNGYLQEKFDFYNNLNISLSELNGLILDKNIKNFMGAYNKTKKIEQINNNFNNILKSKNKDLNILNKLLENIKQIDNDLSIRVVKNLHSKILTYKKDVETYYINLKIKKEKELEEEKKKQNISISNNKQKEIKQNLNQIFRQMKNEKDKKKLSAYEKDFKSLLEKLEISQKEKDKLLEKISEFLY